MNSLPRSPRLRRLGWQAAVLAAAVTLALVLAQHTAGAVFTAQTANGADQVSSAASFCPGSGTATLHPDADTYGYQALPDTLYGSNPGVTVSSGNNANGRVLLHFPLTGVVPAFCSVTGATLSLYAGSPSSGRVIEVHPVTLGSSWDEATTTWNTHMPTYDASPVASSASLTAVGWQQWTVTALVGTMVSAGDNGFLVKDSVEGVTPTHGNVYDSREGTNPPQLTLTWG